MLAKAPGLPKSQFCNMVMGNLKPATQKTKGFMWVQASPCLPKSRSCNRVMANLKSATQPQRGLCGHEPARVCQSHSPATWAGEPEVCSYTTTKAASTTSPGQQQVTVVKSRTGECWPRSPVYKITCLQNCNCTSTTPFSKLQLQHHIFTELQLELHFFCQI